MASLVFACSGCVVETRSKDAERAPRLILPTRSTIEKREKNSNEILFETIDAGQKSLEFAFAPLAVVSYDGFTLPIFSDHPEDLVFATQNGTHPGLRAILGEGTDGISDQHVVINRITSSDEVEIIARHDEPLLLGRNANSRGVLVEKPKPDGSRAIGLASWSDDSVAWLVDDGAVNAFGWITESGRLVYSSRGKGDQQYILKVRENDGRTWSIPETLPYSWILPTWSEDDGGIFAIRMGDGYGDLAWSRSGDAGVFRRSLKTRRISDRFSIELAWQTLASTTGGNGVTDTRLAWFSFEQGGLSLWDGKQDSMRALPESALACCKLEGQDEWLITTDRSLKSVRITEDQSQAIRLLSGPWICRKTSGPASIVVKSYEDTLQLARITFGAVSTPRTVEPLRSEPKAEPEYEYNIRD